MSGKQNKPVKKNVCVLFGGVSTEHEVSLRSANTVLDNIDEDKYRVFPVGIRKDGRWLLHRGENWELSEGIWEHNPGNTPAFLSPDGSFGLMILTGRSYTVQKLDCVFPVLHGVNGEDGSVQGLAQLAGLPCVGCGMSACVAAMDKYMTKLVAADAGVDQAAYVHVTSEDAGSGWKELADSLPFEYPVFVKPCSTGSSVGVTKVTSAAGLPAAVDYALSFSRGALIEENIVGHEIEVAILGGAEPVASECGEIVANADFYDYDPKYINSNSQLLVPSPIPADKSLEIRAAALKVFRAIGGSGLSRADFFLTEDGRVVFNEINAIPGFTSISMYPKLFELAGISLRDLVSKLIDTAIEEGPCHG